MDSFYVQIELSSTGRCLMTGFYFSSKSTLAILYIISIIGRFSRRVPFGLGPIRIIFKLNIGLRRSEITKSIYCAHVDVFAIALFSVIQHCNGMFWNSS